jgi:hypothetical protein
MAYQTGANVLIAIKRETTTGTAATAASATVVRYIDSPGLGLRRGTIRSGEKRADANQAMGRLGNKSVEGTINAEATVGGATDLLLEALMRSAWATTVVVGFATMTTVAIGTNTVTAAGGDWVGGQGLRVGDIFTLSGTTVAGNNNLRTPIVSISSTVITVPAGTFTTLAATATGTLTRLRKLVNGATPTRYSHTIEQYDRDIDLSELFLGCRLTGVRLSLRPNQPVQLAYSFLGMDRTVLTTGTSPWFSSPSETTGLALVADDSSIYKDGVAVATFTGLDLDFQIAARGEPVIGSLVTPDIFDNDLGVTGSITGLRSDFANLTAYDAETEFAIQVVLKEPGTDPDPCLGLFLPRVKISDLSAPVGGGDGAKIETLQLMIGPKVAATGYDGTVASWATSASA